MNAYTTKRLLMAIGQTIQRYEQTFGVIELDVQRAAFRCHNLRWRPPKSASPPASFKSSD